MIEFTDESYISNMQYSYSGDSNPFLDSEIRSQLREMQRAPIHATSKCVQVATNNNMQSKRKALIDLSNISSDDETTITNTKRTSIVDMLPTKTDKENTMPTQLLGDRFQNVHPLLSWYKFDLNTSHISYESFMNLIDPKNDENLITFLTEIGIIASTNICLNCGRNMRKVKEGAHWFWICSRSVNGIRCNKGKKSIRTGTMFDNSQISITTILQLIWHFVHRLNEKQCAQYTNISSKNNTTVVKWYAFCRDTCTQWFWKPENTPKLGGYGVIVEMDESYFPGKPKFNRGRRLGEATWYDDEKWAFGMTSRDSLDAIIKQVPSNRSRKSLLPIIDTHCLPGSIFCSDGWKAYNKLREHLELEDVEHFAVNHSENFVDPDTGAHTQTIEGLWRHCKEFLPSFGLKPAYLHSYIGTFCWHRYTKQRKLDMFVHFLKCAAEIHPPVVNILPVARMAKVCDSQDDDFMP